jgi:hypothetical protein
MAKRPVKLPAEATHYSGLLRMAKRLSLMTEVFESPTDVEALRTAAKVIRGLANTQKVADVYGLRISAARGSAVLLTDDDSLMIGRTSVVQLLTAVPGRQSWRSVLSSTE